ncbi:MAG: alpha/beta hydrolase [Ruminococcaceae bacterium]|nr:alpha/beta hydrolase [Oscillospiraceae bacterium]
MIVALVAGAVLVAFCFGVGAYTFYAACHRGKPVDWMDEQALKQTPFGQFYGHIQAGDAWLRAHPAEDVYIHSHDGLRLHATWIPAENARGTIVLVHGYHSCILADFGLAFEAYHRQGLNILVPDQRAHGRSEGKYITFGILESCDILRWIHYHDQHLSKLPVVCSGLSMGAATVMYLADMELPDSVKGFIADCGYTSPKQIIGKVFRDIVHIPSWPFLWAASLTARCVAGVWLGEKNTEKTLVNNTRPILFIHGTADTFVPCEMTKRSFEASGGEKELLLVQGATHGVSYLKAKEEYIALVNALLDKCLKQ